MVDWVHCLRNCIYNIIIYLIVLYYSHFINNFCLSSEVIYLSLAISISCSFAIVSELICGKVFEIFVILSAILLPVKSPVAPAVTLFEVVLSPCVLDCLVWLRSLWLYLPFTFLLTFLPIFLPIFSAKDENQEPFGNIKYLFWY